jgi:hypothetical protein
VDDLVAALRAAIDADERIALAVGPEDQLFDGTGIVDAAYVEGPRRMVLPSHLARYLARHDPARVLRQVAAHRKILRAHPIQSERRGWDAGTTWYGCRCALDEDGDILFSREILCEIIPPLAEGYGIQVEEKADNDQRG